MGKGLLEEGRAVIFTLASMVLCSPLFVVCAAGDPRYPESVSAMDAVFALIAFLPMVAVMLASPFQRLQTGLLVALGMLVLLEVVLGIEPTSQLNHEGSDLVFLGAHFLYFILGFVATLLLASWRLVRRLIG